MKEIKDKSEKNESKLKEMNSDFQRLSDDLDYERTLRSEADSKLKKFEELMRYIPN